VHTVAGTSGTIKISALSDLGYALEKALQKLATSELSEDEQSLVGEAIDTIETMVASVVKLRVPRAVPELVARLERIGEEADVSQESTTREGREPPSQSPSSRETESSVSEEVTETEEGDSSLDELDL